MRTNDPDPQPFQPLGQKVTPSPPPAPDPKQIAPGVLQRTDGKLYTNLPLPKDRP